jgi:hypothetical protein
MSLDRAGLKRAAVALLDAVAQPHPAGHQAGKAARYVLTAVGGSPLEVMFEKDEDSSVNLWVASSAAGALLGGGISQRSSLARSLRTKIGKDGKPLYGRHSGLMAMAQLADADLVCFQPATLAELGAILDQLLAASAARIAI